VTHFLTNVTRFTRPINTPNTIFIPLTSKSSQTLPNFHQNPNLRNSNFFLPTIFMFSSPNHKTNPITSPHHHHPTKTHHLHTNLNPNPIYKFFLTLTMVDTCKKGKTHQSKKAKIVSKRKQPVKPTAATPQPPSINHRFLTTLARDRFKEIQVFRVIQEREFLLPKLLGNPEFEQVLTARGWHGLNDMVFKEANKTLALEFYAKPRFSSGGMGLMFGGRTSTSLLKQSMTC